MALTHQILSSVLLCSWALPAAYAAALPAVDDSDDLTILVARKKGGGSKGSSSSSSGKSVKMSTGAIIAIVVVVVVVVVVGLILWKCVLPRLLAKRQAKKLEQEHESKPEDTLMSTTTGTPQPYQQQIPYDEHKTAYQQPPYQQAPYSPAPQNNYGPPSGPPPAAYH